jgi:hypothetical protein
MDKTARPALTARRMAGLVLAASSFAEVASA